MDRRFFEISNNDYIESTDNNIQETNYEEDYYYDNDLKSSENQRQSSINMERKSGIKNDLNDNNKNNIFLELEYITNDEGVIKNRYFDTDEITEFDDECNNKYFDQEEFIDKKGNCNCDNRYFEQDEVIDNRDNNDYCNRYLKMEENKNSKCGCNNRYYELEENDEEDIRYNDNCKCDNKYLKSDESTNCTEEYEFDKRYYGTFEDENMNKRKNICCNGNKIGYKEGYKAGYDDGVKDAVKEAYKAGFKCGLKVARYRRR